MTNKQVENEKANSFLIYKDYETYIETLSREQKGDLFSALFVYFRTGSIPEGLDIETNLLMKVFAVQMDRDLKKYEKKIEARRQAGIKSAEAKKARNAEECTNDLGEVDFAEPDLAEISSFTDSSTNSTSVTFVENSITNSTNSTYNSNNNNNSNSNSNCNSNSNSNSNCNSNCNSNNNTNNNSNSNFNSNSNSNGNDDDDINSEIIDTDTRLKEIYSRLFEEHNETVM